MEFLVLKITTLVIIYAALTPTVYSANLQCDDHCGNISIPYPFGTTENCYHSYGFFVTCNHTFDPPKLFMQDGEIEVAHISLDGQLKLMQFIATDCYARNGTRSYNDPFIELPISITVNNTANRFTVVGCDTYAFVYGRRLDRNYTTGCTAMCDSMDDLVEGSCMGLGCCQNVIPRDVWRVDIELWSYNNHSDVLDFNNCSYGFLAEESAFIFSQGSFTNLKNVEKLPMVADWAIGNGTCEDARMNSSSYACKSVDSECYKPDNGYGYRCRCLDGYEGNPYLINGCQDRDECAVPVLHNCKHGCKNTIGGFKCPCPKGYRGDGRIGGQGCIRVESLMFKFLAGISLAGIGLLLAICCLYLELRRRQSTTKKQKFFLQNGGVLLQEKLIRRERSSDMVRIFSSSELAKATNDFHVNMIIGQGGFGTVYKGLLPDYNIVAIKKSKRVDLNQIDQFINEVIVLSQINHRNVVKLLGCCLETEIPLLVYEFIDNGTLSTNIHDHVKARFINWSMRLKIAAETAGVLSYLHSAASTPIIHRDIKSDNILLDRAFTAKVADFGASRLVPIDKAQLSTMVQGTFGYLDPEYLQTNQLTEKSDVYSFGVVLLELLTGRKALSFDRPENEQNLANFFLSILKQDRLFQVIDVNIVGSGNMEQIIEVAKLAQWCLHVKGEDRPSMKQVAMELDRLRLGGKNTRAPEESETWLGVGFDGLGCSNGNTLRFEYDSVRDHVMLPISGGR